MTKLKFEVIIDINDRKPVDDQIYECCLEDEEDEEMFEAVTGKKFPTLTEEQQEWVAIQRFFDDIEDGFAGEDFDFKFIGIVEAAKKKPVTKKVKADAKVQG